MSSKYNKKTIESCKRIIRELGYIPNLVLTTKNPKLFLQDFKEKASKANNSDIVITYGGDGFFGLYQDFIHKHGQHTPLGHVPIGTTNDMIGNLGLSNDPIENTRKILQGEIVERDIICSNDNAFGYISTFGTITNIPYDTPPILKKIGSAGYLIAALPDIIKVLKKQAPTYKIRYEQNGYTHETECLIGAISNAKGFGGVKIYPDAKQNDSKFEVLLAKPEIIDKGLDILHDFKEALILGENPDIKLLENYKNEIISFTTSELLLEFPHRHPKKHFDNDGDKGPKLKVGEPMYYEVYGKCKLLLPKNTRI